MSRRKKAFMPSRRLISNASGYPIARGKKQPPVWPASSGSGSSSVTWGRWWKYKDGKGARGTTGIFPSRGFEATRYSGQAFDTLTVITVPPRGIGLEGLLQRFENKDGFIPPV